MQKTNKSWLMSFRLLRCNSTKQTAMCFTKYIGKKENLSEPVNVSGLFLDKRNSVINKSD